MGDQTTVTCQSRKNCSRSGRMQPSDELEKVRVKIEELEEQVKGTNAEAVRTALHASLTALQEKEVLIMRGKQACSEPWLPLKLLLENTLMYSDPPAEVGGGGGVGSGGGEISSDPSVRAGKRFPCHPLS